MSSVNHVLIVQSVTKMYLTKKKLSSLSLYNIHKQHNTQIHSHSSTSQPGPPVDASQVSVRSLFFAKPARLHVGPSGARVEVKVEALVEYACLGPLVHARGISSGSGESWCS